MTEFVYNANFFSSSPNQEPTGKYSNSNTHRNAPTIIKYLTKQAHNQRKYTSPGSNQYTFESIDARPEPLGNIALYGCTSHNCTVATQKTTNSPVNQHQRIRKPKQTHIHCFINLINKKCKTILLLIRNIDSILQCTANCPSYKLYNRKC